MPLLDDILVAHQTLGTRNFIRLPFNLNLGDIEFDHPALYFIYFNTGEFYVGCTKGIKNRINQHRGYLRSDTHVNKILQSKYNESCEDAIDLLILPCTSKKEAVRLEATLLNKNYSNPKCLNIVSNEKTFTYGERLDKLRKFANSTENKLKVSSESTLRWRDPDYRNKVLTKIGSEVIVDDVTYYSYREASRKTGFSVEALKRNAKNNRVISSDIQYTQKAVMADGVKYIKVGDAAKAYGVKDNTMTWRLKSTATRWKNFYYL